MFFGSAVFIDRRNFFGTRPGSTIELLLRRTLQLL